MQRRIAALAAVFVLSLIPAPALPQQKGGEDVSGPYDVVEKWPQSFTTPGYMWASQGGVFAESPNRVFLLNRGEVKIPEKLPDTFTGSWGSLGRSESNSGGTINLWTGGAPEIRNCIVVVDANGKMVESWTQWDHLFKGGRGPHTIHISPYDPERHVWVVDDKREQVFKFTNDGKKLVMTLGEAGVPGNDEKHFGDPTGIAWLPDGTFFVSDGYVNTRIVKFDKNGKFLMAWGTKGEAPGQFNTPHSIAIDKNRRIYVSDRSNGRIQVFDENGKFLDQWPDIHAYYIEISPDQHLWASDGTTNKFLKYDLNGKLLYSWGTFGTFPGAFWGIHQFSTDSAGNLYAAEPFGGRTQKFRPKPGAESSKLIGLPQPLMPLSKSSN